LHRRSLFALFTLSACASKAVEGWSSEPNRPVQPAAVGASPPPIEPSQLSPEQCEEHARAFLLSGQSRNALSALSKCTQREDFNELRRMMRPPWAEWLKANGVEGARLVGRIIARHDYVEAKVDMGVSRDVGIQLRGMDEIDDGADVPPGLVLVRGRIAKRKGSKPGTSTYIEEVEFDVPEQCLPRGRHGHLPRNPACYESGNSYSHVLKRAWIPSRAEREIVVRHMGGHCAADRGDPSVFLVRVDRLEQLDSAENDLNESPANKKFTGRVFVTIIECFSVSYLK
jgi:hypothetical protein